MSKLARFREKPEYEHSVGGAFDVRIYVNENNLSKCRAEISTVSGVWGMTVRGQGYMWLRALAQADNVKEIDAYCVLMYRMSNEIFADSGLANDVIKALGKYDKRTLKKAGKEAEKVADEDEIAADAFMRDAIERGSMGEKEQKAASEEEKAVLREIIDSHDEKA